MKNFIGKIYVAIAFLMIASMNYAHGDFNNLSTGETGVNCCESNCCGGDLFISGDFLYWRAFESGLDICVPRHVSDTIEDDIVISRFNGKGRNPHFKWDPGFRVGAGFEFGSNNWDIGAFWTHFHSHAHSSNDEDELHWKINFDVIDIVAGYNCDLGSCFSLRPFLGIRGARIDQKLHVKEFPLSSDDDPITIARNNKEDFRGIGPLLGLEFDWDIGCGFSFYTNASISWLYGNFDVKFFESDITEGFSDFFRVKKHPNANLAAADAALGVRWRTCICENMQLVLQLGLEHHRYFDYNRFGNYGDLSFDGANFSVGIEF
jgi:Legionella pneumophila major outer membrane protein precursor